MATQIDAFTSPGSFSWTVPAGVSEVEVLVVAGGGGGGVWRGGGGGAGGLIHQPAFAVAAGAVLSGAVGAGGSGGNGTAGVDGSDSLFDALIAVGGGGGGLGTNGVGAGRSGGSGGGAASESSAAAGGSGVAGQGHAGGDNYASTFPTGRAAGGGGGASEAGQSAVSSIGGDGGAGLDYTLSFGATYGDSGWFAGGGGGSTQAAADSQGIGGQGGGGLANASGNAEHALANTGGGGGGAGGGYNSVNLGGDGGSGIVIVRYTTASLTVESIWDSTTSTFGIKAGWTEITGTTDWRLRLYDNSATRVLLEEINTTALTHTFTGYAAGTTYNVELTGFNGTTELNTYAEQHTTAVLHPVTTLVTLSQAVYWHSPAVTVATLSQSVRRHSPASAVVTLEQGVYWYYLDATVVTLTQRTRRHHPAVTVATLSQRVYRFFPASKLATFEQWAGGAQPPQTLAVVSQSTEQYNAVETLIRIDQDARLHGSAVTLVTFDQFVDYALINNWELSAPTERQTIYVLDIGDLRVPISSAQATMRRNGQSFLQAVIPNAGTYVTEIATAINQPMKLRKGYQYADGSMSPLEPIAEAPFQISSRATGPVNDTLSISGYGEYVRLTQGTRDLEGVQTRTIDAQGLCRIRSAIDLFLRPGHIARDIDGQEMAVDVIQYFVSAAGEAMEVIGEYISPAAPT